MGDSLILHHLLPLLTSITLLIPSLLGQNNWKALGVVNKITSRATGARAGIFHFQRANLKNTKVSLSHNLLSPPLKEQNRLKIYMKVWVSKKSVPHNSPCTRRQEVLLQYQSSSGPWHKEASRQQKYQIERLLTTELKTFEIRNLAPQSATLVMKAITSNWQKYVDVQT